MGIDLEGREDLGATEAGEGGGEGMGVVGGKAVSYEHLGLLASVLVQNVTLCILFISHSSLAFGL